MKMKFESVNLQKKTLLIIRKANEILAEYTAAGYDSITLRQLFYQLVSRDIIPNTQKEYSKLGDAMSSGRRAGLIDWDHMVDRTRFLRKQSAWDNPADIIKSTAYSYNLDWWKDQTYRPHCWVEKDALIGVIERACNRLNVPHFSCRGYVSDSELWLSAQRFKAIIDGNQIPLVIHLGDHDPSGLDMTRDVAARLSMFARSDISVQRIALNWDQIEQYKPPPNFAKQTDSRFQEYQEEFGDESWELDALRPEVLDKLITDTITPLIDQKKWKATEKRLKAERAQLSRLSEEWTPMAKFLDVVPPAEKLSVIKLFEEMTADLKKKPPKKKKGTR